MERPVPQVDQLDLQQGLHKATVGLEKATRHLGAGKSLDRKATGNGAPPTVTGTISGEEAPKREGKRKGSWRGKGSPCLST